MIYKFLNGNDLNWDEMMSLNYFVEDIEIAIFNGEAETDEDGNIASDYYDGMMDGNPTVIYYDGEDINIQNILESGDKLINHLDWFIVHDTNDNFVTFEGDVPKKYLLQENS